MNNFPDFKKFSLLDETPTVASSNTTEIVNTNADPVAAYREELRKKVEEAIVEIDKELKVWPEQSPGYYSRIGRKNACFWFLSLLEQK